MVKPFSPKELSLRVKAILKRAGRAEEPAGKARWLFKRRTLEMIPETHRASIDGIEIHLTAAEWKILDYIAEGSERAVDTHIKNLRAKFGDPGIIETVRGYGYRFAGARR